MRPEAFIALVSIFGPIVSARIGDSVGTRLEKRLGTERVDNIGWGLFVTGVGIILVSIGSMETGKMDFELFVLGTNMGGFGAGTIRTGVSIWPV